MYVIQVGFNIEVKLQFSQKPNDDTFSLLCCYPILESGSSPVSGGVIVHGLRGFEVHIQLEPSIPNVLLQYQVKNSQPHV